MLTELEFRRRSLIKDLVDHPDFDSIFQGIKTEMAMEMLTAEDENVRDSLYSQALALETVRGRLVKLANDVRMFKHG
jgi:fumarate hydratase class II